MLDQPHEGGFQSINRGYNSVFRPGHLSLGLVVLASETRDDPRLRLAITPYVLRQATGERPCPI